MANGKITYTPLQSYSLTLDGSHHCTLADDNTLDMGTSDFAVDWVGVVSGGTFSTNWAKLAGKYEAGAVNCGWMLWAHDGDKYIQFEMDDGDGSLNVIQTDNNAITLGTPCWVRVECDRDGLGSIYINGALAKTGSIATRASTIDNAESLLIGQYVEGSVSLCRLDKGRLLGATWIAQEWDRLRYGWPKDNAYDFTEVWTFGQTLVGLSSTARTLTHTGTAAYVSGYPYSAGAITGTFTQNFTYGHSPMYEELGETSRAESGALRSYRPYYKRYWTLTFPAVTYSQMAMIHGAWISGGAISFYENADYPETISGVIARPPSVNSVPAFSGGLPQFAISIEIQET